MPIHKLVARSSAHRGYAVTNVGTVRRWSIVLVVLSDLVEVILVQLSDKASKVTVLEMFG
jgi:hypothetical protein